MSDSEPLSAQRALSAKWRGLAEMERKMGDANRKNAPGYEQRCAARSFVIDQCADELDALPSIPDVRKLDTIIAEMQHASDLADDASGTGEYQTRLIALALIARHFLRERDTALAGGQQ